MCSGTHFLLTTPAEHVWHRVVLITGKTGQLAFVLGITLQFLDPAQSCETPAFHSLCDTGLLASTDYNKPEKNN